MAQIGQARTALVRRILDGDGRASTLERKTAFNNNVLGGPMALLVDKVARHAYQVTDEDITSAKMSGLSEDQVFEMVVCAAIGQATRQYDAALMALEAAAGNAVMNAAGKE